MTPEWVTWSMTPHSEDEIRKAVFKTPKLICWTYICRFSVLSEQFIEEALVLSTGVFDGVDEELYTEENKKLVRDILYMEPTVARKELQKDYIKRIWDILEDHKIAIKILGMSSSVRSRVDWFQIAGFQDITPDFKKKFEIQFMKAKINSESKFKENKRNVDIYA
jgi:hypothetical protein